MPAQATGFTATGEAVDEGLLCPEGDATWGDTLHATTGLPETEPPEDGDVMWVETTFACADDSGQFTLRAELTVNAAALEAAVDTGATLEAGSLSLQTSDGDYLNMTVQGKRQAAVVTAGGFDDGAYEVFSGTLTTE